MTAVAENPIPGPPYTWVDTVEGFVAMVERLSSARRLAIDTETDSLYHYVQKVCLLQISSDDETYVVCPFAVTDLSRLKGLAADATIEKVFHAAGADVASLWRDHGLAFTHVFDTHIAAQLVGHEAVGLSALLEQMLGIAHSKRRQRDDWSRRPLSVEQLTYAAMDTHHLLALRDLLETQLREKGRLYWAHEEFELIAEAREQKREFDAEGFRKIKGCRDLHPRQQTVLQALYVLRERLAQNMDIPPFKVMGDQFLINLVRHPPHTAEDLSMRKGVSPRVARRHASEILETMIRARSGRLVSPERRRVFGSRPPADAMKRVDDLKRWRHRKAAELALPSGIVFPGSQLGTIALRFPRSSDELSTLPGMRRWRVSEFGEEILQVLHAVAD